MNEDKIGFIGAGSLAECLISALVKKDYNNIIASRRTQSELDRLSKQYRIKTTTDNIEVLNDSTYVILCVKPGDDLNGVLEEIKSSKIDYSEKVFITIAATVRKKQLTNILGQNTKIGIVIPTVGSIYGEGVSIYSSNNTEIDDKIEAIFGAGGYVQKVDEDKVIQSAQGACLPGWDSRYVLKNLEMLRKYFPDNELSKKFIINNLRGVANMLEQNESDDLQALKNYSLKVGKPGKSITYQGIELYEKNGFYKAIEKSHELVGEIMKKY